MLCHVYCHMMEGGGGRRRRLCRDVFHNHTLHQYVLGWAVDASQPSWCTGGVLDEPAPFRIQRQLWGLPCCAGNAGGFQLYTLDHDLDTLRLDLEAAWADTAPLRLQLPPHLLLQDPPVRPCCMHSIINRPFPLKTDLGCRPGLLCHEARS